MSAGEVFLLCRWVRASAPAGVAPEPPGDSGRIVWVFSCCQQGKFSFCQRVSAIAPTGVAPEPSGGSGRTVWGVLFQRAFSLR